MARVISLGAIPRSGWLDIRIEHSGWGLLLGRAGDDRQACAAVDIHALVWSGAWR